MEGAVCCFTGHRYIDTGILERLSALLGEMIDRLIAKGVTTFRAGGAMGFDTLAALAVLDRRSRDARVRLELYLPCKEQADAWDERSKKYYRYILERADSVFYVREHYVKGCMHERNRALVDGASFCIAYCTHDAGGSAYTVNYAKKQGLRVLNLSGLL